MASRKLSNDDSLYLTIIDRQTGTYKLDRDFFQFQYERDDRTLEFENTSQILVAITYRGNL